MSYFCDGRNVECWFGGTDDAADITVKSMSATLRAGRPLSSTRFRDHDRMNRA